MAVMPDKWIRTKAEKFNMIEPFVDCKNSKGVISYGLSSYGYDARIDNKFKIFTNINSTIIDPKNFSLENFIDKQDDICIIPPNSCV